MTSEVAVVIALERACCQLSLFRMDTRERANAGASSRPAFIYPKFQHSSAKVYLPTSTYLVGIYLS